jgi:hypothetical protein
VGHSLIDAGAYLYLKHYAQPCKNIALKALVFTGEFQI